MTIIKLPIQKHTRFSIVNNLDLDQVRQHYPIGNTGTITDGENWESMGIYLLDQREAINLLTVSAQTVLSSRVFQPTTVRGKKLFLKTTVLVVPTAKQRVFLLAE